MTNNPTNVWRKLYQFHQGTLTELTVLSLASLLIHTISFPIFSPKQEQVCLPLLTAEPTATLIVTATVARCSVITTTAAISLKRDQPPPPPPTEQTHLLLHHHHHQPHHHSETELSKKVPLDDDDDNDRKSAISVGNKCAVHDVLRHSSKKGRFRKSKSSVQKKFGPQGLGEHSNNQQKQKSKSENRARKALRTISFILGAFIVCWTPYHIAALVEGFCTSSGGCVNRHIFYFTYFLCYANRYDIWCSGWIRPKQ